jgi:hypothetical protein
MSLQKEIKTRIRKESIEYAPTDMNLKLAYQAGATTEAERAGKLVAALVKLRKHPRVSVQMENTIETALNEYLHPSTKQP